MELVFPYALRLWTVGNALFIYIRQHGLVERGRRRSALLFIAVFVIMELAEFAIPDAGGAPEDDPIKEAKNVLTLVQATAELFKCTFEEAKRINYLDAMLALSKRHEENEKQKAEMKKHYKS